MGNYHEVRSFLCKGVVRSWLWLLSVLFVTIIYFQFAVLFPAGDSFFTPWNTSPQQQQEDHNYDVHPSKYTMVVVNGNRTVVDSSRESEKNHNIIENNRGDGPVNNGSSSEVQEKSRHNLDQKKKSRHNGKLKLTTKSTKHNTSSSLQEKSKTSVESKDVYTLKDMDVLLTEGFQSSRSTVPLWSSETDQDLLYAKSEIDNAHIRPNNTGLYEPIFRNLTKFHRSYELMEKMLKIYIYKEGDKPVFHDPNLKGIYASEGWFMKQIEASKDFVTNNPKKAHLFYLPFSSQQLVSAFYVPESHSRDNLVQYLKDYLDMISDKYPFWKRTGGADHFIVSCHDWVPAETNVIMSTCIRALCNANVKLGFVFGKDISLPEMNVGNPDNPLKHLGGELPSKRKTLAFFAGQMHGYLRPILLNHWENVDPEMKIFKKLPYAKDNLNYITYMRTSKYCICARGYQVHTPRVLESIYYECVPVIISDNFVPPLFETLNWELFAVFVAEKDIPRLKEILMSIPEKKYRKMYKRVKMVQRHFLWNLTPEKYDLFHMILHSIWYNRVYQFSKMEM